jgi:hypothetical protein
MRTVVEMMLLQKGKATLICELKAKRKRQRRMDRMEQAWPLYCKPAVYERAFRTARGLFADVRSGNKNVSPFKHLSKNK